jgi:hypothetical protein
MREKMKQLGKTMKHFGFAMIMGAAVTFGMNPISQPTKQTQAVQTQVKERVADASAPALPSLKEISTKLEVKVKPKRMFVLNPKQEKTEKDVLKKLLEVKFIGPILPTMKQTKKKNHRSKKLLVPEFTKQENVMNSTDKEDDCVKKAIKDHLKLNGPSMLKPNIDHCIGQKPTSQPTSRPTSRPVR